MDHIRRYKVAGALVPTSFDNEPRHYLEQLYRAALDRVGGSVCVARVLPELNIEAPVRMIAIGKAASSMAQGAFDTLGDQVQAALVITKHGHLSNTIRAHPRVHAIESGHPFPDEASLVAGQHLLAFLRESPSNSPFLFLISGGASSLVEVLVPDVDLAFLRRANRWLVGSGLDIGQVNQVRKALSQIKGGGLVRYLNGRAAYQLLISDVPGDRPEDIGSGLLTPSASRQDLPELPAWLSKVIANAPPSPTGQAAATRIIARNADAKDAVRVAVDGAHPVRIGSKLLSGSAEECGQELARELIDVPAGVYVWGGETTVELPEQPGRGGRCQHLALAAAMELAGCEDVVLLAAGTDGTDGPTEDAGALVDGASLARGEAQGLNGAQSLATADAGRFLQASGDLIRTGPTGTNVMDLVIGLKKNLEPEGY